jgi:hypothetical protein
MKKRVSLLVLLMLVLPVMAFAADDAGRIVALKGKAVILRDNKTMDAVLKDTIMLRDTAETKEASRLKIFFRDDSILTLAEKSRVVIREYLGAGDKKKGKSVFNLVEGKLRSLVGNNEFEVHTPTAVVAARGTYFIAATGVEEGIRFSIVTVIEGVVDISNIDPAIVGVVKLEKGTTGKVFQNKAPLSFPTPKTLLNQLIDATELQNTPEVDKKAILEERKPAGVQSAPLLMKDSAPITRETLPALPPIENLTPPIKNLPPPSNGTPVTIVPIFP